ncbi:flagellar hook-associated protein FlgL [bacterium]|nr:flagellar hook-associated protein FlgL [bacterium]
MGIRVSNNMVSKLMVQRTSEASGKIYKIQQQIASGNRFQHVSEDPYAGMQVLKIKSQLSGLSDWDSSVANAKNQIEMTYDTLSVYEDNLQRIYELSVTLASDIHSASTRDAIMTEINERTKTIESLANTQYQGDYIFGGSNTKNQPYTLAADGNVTYAGSSADKNWKKQLEVSDGDIVQTNVLGLDVFGDNTSGIFVAMRELNEVVNTEPYDVKAVLAVQEQIQNSITSVVDTLGEISGYANKLDAVQSINEKITTRLTEQKSELYETDIVQAASDLSMAQTSLQATLQISALMLGGATLLDYI